MNAKFLLGVAAGFAAAWFLTTPKGQEIIETISDSTDDLLEKGEEVLNRGKKQLGLEYVEQDKFVRNAY